MKCYEVGFGPNRLGVRPKVNGLDLRSGLGSNLMGLI